MKHLTLFFFSFSLGLFSQEINYQLFIKDVCKDSVYKSIFYSLKKDNQVFEVINFDSTSIRIPKEGTYRLISPETFENYKIEISQSNSRDTLLMPTVYEYIRIPPPSYSRKNEIPEIGLVKLKKAESRSIFKRCDSILDGKAIDYYNNGNVRIEGTFKNGFARGTVKEYHQNGKLKRITIYDEEGFIFRQVSYDQTGTEIKK